MFCYRESIGENMHNFILFCEIFCQDKTSFITYIVCDVSWYTAVVDYCTVYDIHIRQQVKEIFKNPSQITLEKKFTTYKLCHACFFHMNNV